MPVPGAVAIWFATGDCGNATPPGDSMIVSLPSVPANRWLSPYSSPAAPCPEALVNPTTGAAKIAVRHDALRVGDQRDAGEGVRRDLLRRSTGAAGGRGRRSPTDGAAAKRASWRGRGGSARARAPSARDGRPGSRRPRRRPSAPTGRVVTHLGRRCRLAARAGARRWRTLPGPLPRRRRRATPARRPVGPPAAAWPPRGRAGRGGSGAGRCRLPSGDVAGRPAAGRPWRWAGGDAVEAADPAPVEDGRRGAEAGWERTGRAGRRPG